MGKRKLMEEEKVNGKGENLGKRESWREREAQM